MDKWDMMRLGDIGESFIGLTYKPENIVDDGIIVLRSGNVQNNAIDLTDIVRVDKVPKNKLLVRDGDILMCSRNGSANLVGKSTMISNLPENMTFGAFMMIYRSKSNPYITHFFHSPYFKRQLTKSATTTINQITKSMLDEVKIPLPPIDEQNRIAKNLDLASEIVKGYKEQLAELDKLVQSVFYEMFGDPLLNPFVFPISTLDNLADVVSGITKGRKLGNSQQLFEVPYMAVSNVKAGYIDWTTVKTITATQEEIERYRIFENDILMTEGGDPDKLGRGSIINEVPQNCIHQNHIFRVRCKSEGVIPQYFSKYLKHASAKQYFLRCAKQTTGIASINMTQLRSLPVIVPPLPLQTRFASIVTEIETQKAQVQQALTEAGNLFNRLMQEYFE